LRAQKGKLESSRGDAQMRVKHSVGEGPDRINYQRTDSDICNIETTKRQALSCNVHLSTTEKARRHDRY
jgi:hypothetical protein